jgi:hypothetical protein
LTAPDVPNLTTPSALVVLTVFNTTDVFFPASEPLLLTVVAVATGVNFNSG